jgi:arylsulfatase A-like enzyme
VVDIAPTVMEAARLPYPRVVSGTRRKPFEGVSLAYTLNDAQAKGRWPRRSPRCRARRTGQVVRTPFGLRVDTTVVAGLRLYMRLCVRF